MFTLIGFHSNVQGNGALHFLDGISDDSVNVEGDKINVPQAMTNVIGAAALTPASTITQARIESPALRRVAYQDIEPIVDALTFGSPPEGVLFPKNPTPLTAFEQISMALNTTNGSAVDEVGLVWLSDGAQAEITGQIYSVRATSEVTEVMGQWVNGKLTFDQNLPAGSYNVVGLRARSATLLAARLNFIGAGHRPGVPAVNAVQDEDHRLCRFGKFGVFGEFTHVTPPTIECLGNAGTSQDYILDLIKTA